MNANRSEPTMKIVLLIAALVSFAASAQDGPTAGFPPNSIAASAQELRAHLSGNSFQAKYRDGTTVTSKFDVDGGLSATAPAFYDTGRWKVEDGKVCGSLRKNGAFCNEARFDAGTLYLRRMNGEVIRYDPE